MANKPPKNLIVGLDIGTSKVSALVGEVTPEGLEVIGLGTHRSVGLKRGVVVNIDATVQAIRDAVRDAGDMSGYSISQVYTGIAGNHIRSLNSNGIPRSNAIRCRTSN